MDIGAWECPAAGPDVAGDRPAPKTPLLPLLARRSGVDAAVITAVGAGGKTTLLHALADEAVAAGLRVVLTTTTHMFCEDGMATSLDEACARLTSAAPQPEAYAASAPRAGMLCVTGRPLDTGASQRSPSEKSAPAKFTGWGEAGLERLREAADLVLIEGDGSRRLPFKVPGSHEPVVPWCTDLLLVVASIGALGRPLAEVCQRHERAASLLPGTGPTDRLDERLAARLIREGYLRHAGLAAWERRRCVVLTHADDLDGRHRGEEVATYLTEVPVVCTGHDTSHTPEDD